MVRESVFAAAPANSGANEARLGHSGHVRYGKKPEGKVGGEG